VHAVMNPLVAIAALLPLLASLVYFVVLGSSSWAPVAYGLSKLVQFALPLVALSLPWRPARTVSRGRAVGWGLAAGAILAAAIVVGATLLLDPVSVEVLRQGIAVKLEAFGLATPTRYLAAAFALSFVHSALEEYYWRWFLFGALRRHHSRSAANCISSLAFAAHHAVVIAAFLGLEHWPLVVVGSLGVALAGTLWTELYCRTGRLLAPWLSHALADLAVLGLGYYWIFG
jgi:hypothetical protein